MICREASLGTRATVRFLPASPEVMKAHYISSLVRGVEEEGFAVITSASGREDLLDRQWLVANAGKVHLLHFHWTQYQYDREDIFQSCRALIKYFAKLAVARRLGYGIVWTMHNYMPHEPTRPLLHWIERFFMAQWADAVIVLGARGRDLLRWRLWRTRDVFLIPHGDYTPFMEHPARAESRRLLGLNGHETAFLFFGQIRPYKGVPELLRAFSQVKGDNLRLFVAGSPSNEALRREVEALATPDPRVRLMLYHIPEHELCMLLSAVDAATLPYRDILGSSVLMTALGFGLPVIAPRIGSFSDVVTPQCGILYDPGEEGLVSAFEYAMRSDLRAMSVAALTRAHECPWAEMVKQTCAVYAYVLAHKSKGCD
jgi:beta-1,4-mannosyltransferase